MKRMALLHLIVSWERSLLDSRTFAALSFGPLLYCLSCHPSPPPVDTILCPMLPTYTDGTLQTFDLACNKARQTTRGFHAMIKPFSNYLLTHLPGILRLLMSSYSRNVIVTFMNFSLCASLYKARFLIAAPAQCVWSFSLTSNLNHLDIGFQCTYQQRFTIVPFFLLGMLF